MPTKTEKDLCRRVLLRNEQLSKSSWTVYRDLILTVCRENRRFSFVNHIRDAVLAERWEHVFELASELPSQSYEGAAEHFAAHQLTSLIKKYPFPTDKIGFDPEGEALKKFGDAEELCRQTNERLREYNTLKGLGYGSKYMNRTFLDKVAGYIADLLGDAPNLDMIYRMSGYSGGASLGVHGNATHVGRKLMADTWSVTSSAFFYARSAIARHHQFASLANARCDDDDNRVNGDAEIWDNETPVCSDDYHYMRFLLAKRWEANFVRLVKIVDYNKISFVEKTSDCSRTIAVEPLLNGFLQKGVDNFMRARLKRRWGLDLSIQDINSVMALLGSLIDTADPFVTIDLSSASDSVCTELVRKVLPAAWFDFLNALRAKNYRIGMDQKSVPYEKFCSMGNGFCFPLETIIFAAIAMAAGASPRNWRVYGDDIIVRKSVGKDVVGALSDLGFKTNARKTFLDGPFRESCGRDWYSGEDVRPFVLDFALDSLQSIFKFLNLTTRNENTCRFFANVRNTMLVNLRVADRFFRPHKGPDDTAITVEKDLFMTSPYAAWDASLQTWRWMEIEETPCVDADFGLHTVRGRDFNEVAMFALLSGSNAERFTLRRKTRTRVREHPHVDRKLMASYKRSASLFDVEFRIAHAVSLTA